jgi:hypothetical protein
MVVVKLLSDKSELDTLHGRIVLGILLTEDILAIMALAMLSNSAFSMDTILGSLLKIIFMLVMLFFTSFYVFPPIFKFAAKTKELLFLVSIAVLFLFSTMAMMLGISLVIGAFIAGVALANLPYNHEIIGKVMSLKDFFATIFFVSIGMSISFGSVRAVMIPLLVFLAIVIFLKPLIMMVIITMFGYRKRPAFLSSLSMAQVSEFALILASAGLAIGHISRDIYTMTILIAVVTMALTSYFIKFDDPIYRFFSRGLAMFERLLPHKHFVYEYEARKPRYDVILCGHNRVGYSILQKIKKLRKSTLVVDFNPEIIKELMERKVPCLYGDLGDIEMIERLNLKDAKVVISTVPEKHDNLLLLHRMDSVGSKAISFVTAMDIEDALELYGAGADYVILPHLLGGEHAAILIERFNLDLRKVISHRAKHIKELRNRVKHGHDRPIER